MVWKKCGQLKLLSISSLAIQDGKQPIYFFREKNRDYCWAWVDHKSFRFWEFLLKKIKVIDYMEYVEHITRRAVWKMHEINFALSSGKVSAGHCPHFWTVQFKKDVLWPGKGQKSIRRAMRDPEDISSEKNWKRWVHLASKEEAEKGHYNSL